MENTSHGRKQIRVAFSDFPGETNPTLITNLLSSRYDILRVEQDPDYVIYSVTGSGYLKFDNAIRIFVTGENIHPDFNLCDYAFTYDWLDFGDRHYRMPNFALYNEWSDITNRGRSNLNDISSKTAFCNFIYTNAAGHPYRDQFFKALNNVQSVESFGGHLRNSKREIAPPYLGDWSKSKVDAQRPFKFTIAFENSTTPGYTTEKLIQALAADTIPIYWGDPLVMSLFNPGRIINANELSKEEAINVVMNLDRDDQAYLKMVNAPFFSDERMVQSLSAEQLLGAFSYIFDQDRKQAPRRNPYFFGRQYEERRRAEVKAGNLLRRLGVLRLLNH